MKLTGRFLASTSGAVVAALGSAVCCAGPTVAAALGVSAAGLSNFLPLRPFLVIAAVGALYYGFHLLEKEDEKACDPEKPCASPAVRRRMRIVLWASTILILFFVSSPIWVRWLF